MRPRSISDEQRFVHVQPDNVHLEAIGRHILPEGSPIMNDGLHLDGTFCDTRRQNLQRSQWRESRKPEFVALIPITPAQLLLGDWVPACRERQTIDLADLVLARQIYDALSRANKILGSSTHRSEAEHAAPAEPPCRRHGRKVRAPVFINAGDKGDGSPEVEDSRLDAPVHLATLAAIDHSNLSVSCAQIRANPRREAARSMWRDKSPSKAFVIQLEEATAEWRRRHPPRKKRKKQASTASRTEPCATATD